MLDNAEFIKSIKGSRFVTGESVRPSTIKDRAADRGLGLARRVNIPTNKREFNTDKPLVAPAPNGTAVSSKGSVPVNPKAVMKERNQTQIDSLQKKEYLKTYLKDKGTGTTSKPETVTRAKYKIASERKEVPVDRPVVNLDGTVTTRTEPKTKREKPLTQEEKLEKARLAGQVAGTKRTAAQQTFEEEFPKESKPTGADKARFDAEKKAEAERLRREKLRENYVGSEGKPNVPLVTPAVNFIGDAYQKYVKPARNAFRRSVAEPLIAKGMTEDQITGTLAGLTFAPIAVGTLAYNDYQRKKDEEKKLTEIEIRRQAVLDRRDAIIKERQNKLQQEMAKYNRKPDSIYATFLNSYEKAVAEFQDPATIQRLIQHGSTYIPQDNTGVVSLEKTLRGKMQKKKLRETKVPASMSVTEINAMIESGKPVGKYFNKTIRKSAEFVIHPNAVRIGQNAGLAAGVLRGTGVGESEEEKAATGIGSRAAKVLGYGLLGKTAGGIGGNITGGAAEAIRKRFAKKALPPNSNYSASFGLLDGTTRVLNKGKNAVRSIHERTKNPDWDAVNAANIGRVAGATAGAIEGSGIDETDEQRANTGLITRAAKVVGLAGVGGSLGAHAGSAVDLGRERLRFGKGIRKAANFESSALVTTPKQPTKPKYKIPLTLGNIAASGAILGGGLYAAGSLLNNKKKKKEEDKNA
jgi:hypothetical protein